MKKIEYRFCPNCGKNLKSRKIIDVFQKGFLCESGHKLYISHYEPYKLYGTDKKNIATGKINKLEVIHEWLSNKNYRKYLTNQFCEFLRAIYEHETGEILNTVKLRSKFCLVDSLKLNRIESANLYGAIYQCKNNHVWCSRNGMRLDKSRERIQLDITEKWMNKLRDSYIVNKKYNKTIPTEIVEIFK